MPVILPVGRAGTSCAGRVDGVRLGVVAVGDTVCVSTAGADPWVLQRLSSPQLSILSLAADEATAVSPVGHGTGPFELTAVDGASGTTVEPFED